MGECWQQAALRLEEALQNLLRRWHLWIFVSCGVANPRRSAATAVVCALQASKNHSASFPQEVLQGFLDSTFP